MKLEVYTNRGVIYSTETENTLMSRGARLVNACEIERTSYGSVIINRDSFEHTLELYPSEILKIKQY